MLTPIVSALTRTSPGPGCGVGTSQYSRTDGPPVRRKRIAFIGASESAFPKRIDRPQLDCASQSVRDAQASGLAVEAVGVVPEELLLRLRFEALPGEDVIDRIWELAFRM